MGVGVRGGGATELHPWGVENGEDEDREEYAEEEPRGAVGDAHALHGGAPGGHHAFVVWFEGNDAKKSEEKRSECRVSSEGLESRVEYTLYRDNSLTGFRQLEWPVVVTLEPLEELVVEVQVAEAPTTARTIGGAADVADFQGVVHEDGLIAEWVHVDAVR